MDDNIMDILDGTINKNIEVNENALEKLVCTIRTKKDLDNYVRGIYFTTQERILDKPMCYHSDRNLMGVNTKKMNQFLRDVQDIILGNGVIGKKHHDIYLKILLEQALLHEMTHAHQDKMRKEKESNIEARLVSLDFHMAHLLEQPIVLKVANFYHPLKKELTRNYKEWATLQKKYKASLITERLAEYHSIKEILSYLSNTNTDYSDITGALYGVLICGLLDGYDFSSNISSPTERYIDDFQQVNFIRGNKYFTKKFYHLLEEAKSDTLERRLSLGLDITRDEYTKVKKIIT